MTAVFIVWKNSTTEARRTQRRMTYHTKLTSQLAHDLNSHTRKYHETILFHSSIVFSVTSVSLWLIVESSTAFGELLEHRRGFEALAERLRIA